jgi:hypothetical protein
MNELDLKKGLPQVRAPRNFEAVVLGEIAHRRRRNVRAFRAYRLAFSGAALAIAAFFVVDLFVLNKPEDIRTAALGRLSGTVASETVPVMETLNYSAELHGAAYEPQTVYILEQVSEASPSGITY